jgi:outer membrane protein assembly factor BamB
MSAKLARTVLTLSLICSALTARAQPPAWPMFHQNAAHTGLSPYSTAGDSGKLKWTYPIVGYADGSPIVGIQGMIYALGSSLYAINPDGTTKWTFSLGGGQFDYATTTPTQGPDGSLYFEAYSGNLYAVSSGGTQLWTLPISQGIFDTDAAIWNDTIYVGSWDGLLYALNFDGTTKWTFAMGPSHMGLYAAPAISHNILYMPNVNTAFPGATAGVYKLRANTGVEMREFQLLHMATFGFAPAVGSDGSVYQVDTRGNLVKFTPSGRAWSVQIAPPNGDHYVDFWSSPAIGADGTVYVGSMDGSLYSVSPSGTVNWTFPLGGESTSSPAIGADGAIYIGGGASFWAINPDGTLKWNFTPDSAVLSSPAIGADGTIYFISDIGTLYALD